MHPRLQPIAVAAAAMGLASAASAQTLPGRDSQAWEPIGSAGGAQYYILPAHMEREGETVRLVVRATVAPMTGTANTVIARIVVDCAASAVSVGTAEFYGEPDGFQRTVEPVGDPVFRPAADPGQLLVIQHVCVG